VAGDKWCFRLEEFIEEHGVGSNAGTAVNITGPNDPQITPANCVAVLHDLTPVAGGGEQGAAGAPYSTYVPLSIVLAHERFHIDDFRNRVVNPTMTQLAAFVSQAANCTDCQSATPTATFDAKMEEYWNANRMTYFDGHHEGRAYAEENRLLGTLTSGIRQRARNAPAAQGWPAACK
jgi:hypothetical protein